MSARAATAVSVVIPTIGRRSLQRTLSALAEGTGPLPRDIVLVDDRRVRGQPLPVTVPGRLCARTRVVAGRAAGPAAARNVGWRATTAPWVAFLDDDVVPATDWLEALHADLKDAAPDVGGIQGHVDVPLPPDARPTDWQRNTAGLRGARWATADMAYQREALMAVAGFDERFRRAYREDADLALRVRRHGYRLAVGTRRVCHPVRPADRWVSIRMQRGNADDALMRRVHGRRWRAAAEVPAGRRPLHLATSGAAVAALGLAISGLRRPAAVAATTWLVGTARFAAERIAPGPRDTSEIATMLLTSAAIPPVATWWWLVGLWRWRRAGRWPSRPAAVLFDRDGTLVRDVPYNADPDRVVPAPQARQALATLRALGVKVGVVSNQSGVARGLLDAADVRAVNDRVRQVVGPIDTFQVCPHSADDGCECRKPAPGLVRAAAAELGADPRHCVVIGDIGSDIGAARRAGAKAILVPTDATRAAEVAQAPYVTADLAQAVRLALRPDFLWNPT